jgi:S1-C subfamily serine protease
MSKFNVREALLLSLQGVMAFFTVVAILYVFDNYDYLVNKYMPMDNVERSVLRVIVDSKGHGSGAHIGKGYVLTSAHVIVNRESNTSLKLLTEDGEEFGASVLWESKDYDVALLEIDNFSDYEGKMTVASIACREPIEGENIMTRGNPSSLNFVSSYGKVAGTTRDTSPTWKRTFIINTVVVPGQSGAPIFDESNKIIGVVAGLLLHPLFDTRDDKPIVTPTMTGYGFAVPSSVICKMLGK